MELTHIDSKNNPKMVDVGQKEITNRVAVASGRIYMTKEAFLAIKHDSGKKGPVLQTAVVAAVMGAKKTSELIPMCHPVSIDGVDIDIVDDELTYSYKLSATIKCGYKTGVEMEALSAVSIGLLTIYDMIKAIDKSMVIDDIKLEFKSGGKNGDFGRKKGKRFAVAFSGPHNSGKTTLIKKLIEKLSSKHRVIAIKHDPKDKAVFDREGKDSELFYRAGAEVFIFSDKKAANFLQSSLELKEIVKRAGEFDYLFLEGLREFELPRLGVFRDEFDPKYLEFVDAIISDRALDVGERELLDINDIDAVLGWIERNAKVLV
jgi:cyclic pyranopterin phosphate synthase